MVDRESVRTAPAGVHSFLPARSRVLLEHHRDVVWHYVLLSFPSSLIGLPVLLAADRILGIDPGSISGMYTNLTILFALGIVQWFWLVPRIWFKKPLIQTLENSVPELQLAQRLDFDRFSSRERTPVERVLDEDRE